MQLFIHNRKRFVSIHCNALWMNFPSRIVGWSVQIKMMHSASRKVRISLVVCVFLVCVCFFFSLNFSKNAVLRWYEINVIFWDKRHSPGMLRSCAVMNCVHWYYVYGMDDVHESAPRICSLTWTISWNDEAERKRERKKHRRKILKQMWCLGKLSYQNMSAVFQLKWTDSTESYQMHDTVHRFRCINMMRIAANFA